AAEPQPTVFVPAPQAKVFEPLRAAAYAPAMAVAEPAPVQEAEIPFEPVAARAEPSPAPAEMRPVAKIEDPSGADDDDLQPLFRQTHYADERRAKGGWLSLFGRPRHEAPQLRSSSQAQPAIQMVADEQLPEGDDLEIPSFLRRLAN